MCSLLCVLCFVFFGDKVNETYLQAQQGKRPYVKLLLLFLIAPWLINMLQLYEIDGEKKFYCHRLVII